MISLAPGFYACKVANSLPRLGMITDEGDVWVGARRIPEHMQPRVLSGFVLLDDQLGDAVVALIKNG